MVQIALRNLCDSIKNFLALHRLLYQKNSCPNIKQHRQEHSHASQTKTCNIDKQERAIAQQRLGRRFPVSKRLPEPFHHSAQHTVRPQRFAAKPPHQTQITAQKQQIKQKSNSAAGQGKLCHAQIPDRKQRSREQKGQRRKRNHKQCRFRPDMIKPVQPDRSLFLCAPARSHGQIHHRKKIEHCSQHYTVDSQPADRPYLLKLLFILLQIVAGHILGINSNRQNIIAFYGGWIALHIAAQLT